LTGIFRAPLDDLVDIFYSKTQTDEFNKFIAFYRQSPKIADLLYNPENGQIDFHAIKIAAREFLMQYLSEVMENPDERFELYEQLTGENGGSLASEIFHLHEYMLPESFQHTADCLLSLAGVTHTEYYDLS